MNKLPSFKTILLSLRKYIIFFLLISFIVTCSFLLFLNGLDLSTTFIRQSASVTLGNILLLSLIFTAVDNIRRRITIEKPVNEILKATDKLTEGDFSTRIPLSSSAFYTKDFEKISKNFNKMAQELEGVEVLRTDFIANVSHELKTPLSIIQNYARLLSLEDLSDEQKNEYAHIIAETSTRLSTLISHILKLNKLENQQISFKKTSYNLAEQLRETLLTYENIIDEKRLTLETDFEEVFLHQDQELLAIVWNNLLSNAIKFTPEGGTISLVCKEYPNHVIIRIKDTGVGISSEVGHHIFEKFYQGDTSHVSKGNGLGLALVKRVIELVEGEINIESTLGKGSTFTVQLNKPETTNLS